MPAFVLSALFGNDVGESAGASLQGFTRDLFLLLLVSLYFEWFRWKDQGQVVETIAAEVSEVKASLQSASPPAFRALALESSDPKEMIDAATRRLFKTDRSTESIVRNIASSRKIYDDVTVEMRATQVKASSFLALMSLELVADIDEVYLGVTKKAEHTSALAASRFDFFEILTITGPTTLEDLQQSLRTQIKIYRRDNSNGFREIPFVAVDKALQGSIISPPSGMTHDDFILFRTPESVRFAGRARIRAEYRLEVPLEDHFVYWCCDRPIFLRQLTIDANEVAAATGRRVQFHLFMGGSETVTLDIVDSRLSVRVDRWILEGHGVVAVW